MLFLASCISPLLWTLTVAARPSAPVIYHLFSPTCLQGHLRALFLPLPLRRALSPS